MECLFLLLVKISVYCIEFGVQKYPTSTFTGLFFGLLNRGNRNCNTFFADIDSKCGSLQIYVNQFRSILINEDLGSGLIHIDLQRSLLISKGIGFNSLTRAHEGGSECRASTRNFAKCPVSTSR